MKTINTKKQYQSPVLKKFGKVGEVTQTGSPSGPTLDATPGTYSS